MGHGRTDEFRKDAVRVALTIARQSKHSFDERDAGRWLMIWVSGC
ncbi:hypothetical protein SAMN06265370_101543 [Puniceibacterium sediminis]|uniref:Uncharacterized protein n=1 Tax=Puniceibacterium sediminis TaxID=1608407 RepID=A0A238V4Q3_9RHOB|nr:hypothetical protein SAMN06265370_101543 [Puniceibacterium sediminis]